ncbi:serine hydrolase [Ekhidna sp.]|jgi:CubicO group peptidase (beta-lactamase class C family)|uniref:serine hydrolase domain-containing protein n=1 Tax=Ekhidna sp. TaxID=2608089 RepID=UPI0032EBA915
MRGYLLIVFVFIGTSAFASDNEVKEEVWIDGDSFYKSIRHTKKSTIYFKKWSGYVDQFLKDENYYVALQLDDQFDPLPKDVIELPSLATIAAIGDDELKKDYFQFLERFGRTHGVNHMVLPDTSEYSGIEREVIKQANAQSPYYFLHRSSLSRSIPDSRKEFEDEAASKPTIWLADQGMNTSKLNRWSNKLENGHRASFYEQLREAKQTSFFPAYELPQSLKRNVFMASTVAVDSKSTFPLRAETITYLGLDIQLKNRLKQYVKVLDYRMPGVPCLVDLRNHEGQIEEDDIILQVGMKKPNHTSLTLPEVSVAEQDVLIAKMLFGAHEIVGRSLHPFTRRIENPRFIGYSDLDHAGMDRHHFQWIDTLAAEAIKKFATPGMQLAVVKNGDIVFEKAYGYYTYDSLREVSTETVYDIASVTKVAGTLPAIALLIDQGKISLDDSVSTHLSIFEKSNKSGVTIRQLLAHNAGLRSYVPFWSMMMDGDRLDAFYYKTAEDEAKDIRTYGLEPHPSMLDSLKSFIVKSKLIKDPKAYNYSDLGFMILHLIVEEISGQPFDVFLNENFYQPMGLRSTTFNPIRNGISPKNIAPTEYDQRYRNYQVWGEVHDRNALVFGGVAGHAGLFSTAGDLSRMMFMFLNGGFYGGRQYISTETLDLLNIRYFENNRRGLGWDKKDGEKDSASSLASDESFGHTGFTGTMVWADPKQELIYVFLSNRIYPDADNWRLGTLNTRTHIHDVIYQSLESSKLRN